MLIIIAAFRISVEPIVTIAPTVFIVLILYAMSTIRVTHVCQSTSVEVA